MTQGDVPRLACILNHRLRQREWVPYIECISGLECPAPLTCPVHRRVYQEQPKKGITP